MAKRESKTARERAEEALGVAERRVKRFETAITGLEQQLRETRVFLEDAKRRRDYAAQHPDLAPVPEAVVETEEG